MLKRSYFCNFVSEDNTKMASFTFTVRSWFPQPAKRLMDAAIHTIAENVTQDPVIICALNRLH